MKKLYFFFFLAIVFLTKAQTTYTYTGKPTYKIDVKRGTSYLGTFKVELFPTIAPHHVRNFDSLVSVQFYDSTAFHRVIPGFVIQGGDPNSRHGPTSTWGYGQPNQPTVNAEFSVAKHIRGILSAARDTNINSATSQFFICVAAAPSLNGQYSIYGRVVSGMNWVDTIVNAPRNTSNDMPFVKHSMYVTYIGSNDSIPNTPTLNTPANHTGTINVAAQQLFKWNSVPGAQIYTVQIASDSLFTNIVKTIQTGNNLTYVSSTFAANTQYFWRVKANNGGHISGWSTYWDFGAQSAVVTGIASQSPDHKVLLFPNPSSGKITLRGLEKGSSVEIYSLNGQLVAHEISKGEELQINLESKPKGVYSYKILSNGKEEQGKFLVE